MSESKATENRPTVQSPGATVLHPAVEVFEDAEGITVIADVPGVSPDRLNVRVDKDTLLIEGSADLEMPQGMQSLHAEVRSRSYRRSFALSSELDADGIEARLKDGVLRLHIPKRAEVRPRRIDVKIA